jgi:hypothetical protein
VDIIYHFAVYDGPPVFVDPEYGAVQADQVHAALCQCLRHIINGAFACV